MRARSTNLRQWTKDADFALYAPVEEGYEPHDWRDPYVFWNKESQSYWMLLAARKAAGPSRHKGCLALAESLDLDVWEVREPFWSPDLYYTHECPDVFRWGEWWYLIYSTFSERCVTHCRMSRALAGPWIAPQNDTFAGRAFYAAKTVSDGERRFVCGWLPTREGECDKGEWQWGGNLVVHELHQEADGALSVRPVQALMAQLARSLSPCPRPLLGKWEMEQPNFHTRSLARFSALSLVEMIVWILPNYVTARPAPERRDTCAIYRAPPSACAPKKRGNTCTYDGTIGVKPYRAPHYSTHARYDSVPCP